ncbi:MAG: Fic family protein [Candidatus Eremiobacteraeota bacterium]|nr:Fic family protein [Candidatus Eremiobacteraeota bacterium]
MSPGILREQEAIFLEEVQASTGLAGVSLSLPEVQALLYRGVAAGEHRFSDYLMVAGYGDAARYVRSQSSVPARRPQPFVRMDELVLLHERATTGDPAARPGEWRRTTTSPFPSGMVPPPAWEVPRAIAAFAERFAWGPPPDVPPVRWVVDVHERFERIHPFASGNGRTGRLLANLLLQRLRLPAFFVAPRAGRTYLDALARADSGNPWPLACVVARSVAENVARLKAASEGASALRPLRELALAADLPSLYKAAQRGRLRSVARGGRLCVREEWLVEYRTQRSRAGRPRALRGGAS